MSHEIDQKEIADLRWRLGMPNADRSDLYDQAAQRMIHFDSQSRKNLIALTRQEIENEPSLRKKSQLWGLEKRMAAVDAKLDKVGR
jgi:hypothetical protein